jgi:hypothetical protein
MRFPFAFVLVLPSVVSSLNCDDLFDFLLEVELCPIDFPPYGYLCWESGLSLQDECEDDIHWWMGVDRECCLASAASSVSAAPNASAARTYIKTNPITPARSITAHPTAHITSTSPAGARTPTNTAKRSTTKTAPRIYPPKPSQSKNSMSQSKSYPAERQMSIAVGDETFGIEHSSRPSDGANQPTAFITAILCVLCLILICAMAACFVALRKKKRIGNEPPREHGTRMVAA